VMDGLVDEVSRMPQVRWKMLLIYPFVPFLFPNVFRTIRMNCGEWLDKHIQDEEVKLLLTTNILYYNDDPYNHSLLHFAVAQAGYIHGGGHYIKGGSQKLSDYLANFIKSNGGQVLLGKKVEELLIENGKAVGVKYRDAFNDKHESVLIYSDGVVANASIPQTAKMLPEPYRQSLESRIKDLKASCSLLSIYIAFDTDLKTFGVRHYSTFVQGTDVNSLRDIKSNNQGDWNNKCFVFVDYSQLDSGIAPTGKSFGVICAADYLSEWEGLEPEAYRTKKNIIAQLFFKRLENLYPGITKHINYYEVGTAKTIERYTLNPMGTPYGYAQSPSQSGLARIAVKSPIKHLYFASAWSFPGGGFTGSIIGGYMAAMSMNNDTRWQKHGDQLLEDSRVVKLLKKKYITDTTIELTFEKPTGFSHVPGQYAIVRLNNPKQTELDLPFRSLSIVSHPDEPTLRFAMRISNSSFKLSCLQMSVGEQATIFGPTGQFVLNPVSQRIVFLISGIGITPVIPMLKELERTQFKGNVYLFYSNKTLSSKAYNNELDRLAIDGYTYRPVITTIESRINADLLKTYLSDMQSHDYFLVGTSEFILAMTALLKTEGVDPRKITRDDFG
jgi:all-trans-retinol 13,14-reductase